MCELLLLLHENAVAMADNYLEKKMDEYRRSSAAPAVKRRLSPSGERPGVVSLRIAPLRVLVTDVSDDYAAAIVRRLREAGCRVAFVAADDKAGRALSQSTGSRYYPASLAPGAVTDVAKAWDGCDAVVFTDSSMPQGVDWAELKRVIAVGADPRLPNVPRHDGMTVNGVSTVGRTPADVAHLCLLLCLTDSLCLTGLVM